mmetsp:Transcript_5891/g.14946  ORF Transcript_5891/g.14946 Transcript_5891/m.14946 type:complete len:151 (+) Transcript_5891:103-555(+)
MGAEACRMQCRCPNDTSAEPGRASGAKRLAHVSVLQEQESRALGADLDDCDGDSITTQEYGVDEVHMKRGIELAASAYLFDEGGTLPRMANEPLPLDKILQIQREMCQKVLEQDRQLRRIVECAAGEGTGQLPQVPPHGDRGEVWKPQDD